MNNSTSLSVGTPPPRARNYKIEFKIYLSSWSIGLLIAYQRNYIWCQILLLLIWDIPVYSYQESLLVPKEGVYLPFTSLLGTS